MSQVPQTGARVFIGAMALSALACYGAAFVHWQMEDPVKFACYLIAALLASSFKVTQPGIEGTFSVNFLFTLLGILELGLPETLVILLASTLAQFYWKPARRLKFIQLVFNLSQLTVASTCAWLAYHFTVLDILHSPGPLALLVAAITHFGMNTAAMAIIIGLTEEKPMKKVWSDNYLWTFPYYMVGAAVAGLISFLNRHIGWQSSLLVLPPIYLMYRSYRLYLGKLEAEKQHAQKLSDLHLRTIEALALAIEAKDQTTGEHLQRVRVYAMELARELGLSEDEAEALRAASVLHDIGKLAVPEHIISKPGKLTPEEFEKMKIHPIVGAEILEQVDFPYPVVPIVRAHHEKWDGSGYPAGLKGEAIPIGARILSAVDCLDALASDRQYRKALPLNDAMAKVASEAGTSFDPQVVGILQKRYIELEKLANQEPLQAPPKLSTDIKVERGLAPAAGFAEPENAPANESQASSDELGRIAAAREEAQAIFELSENLGISLSLDDMLSVLSTRIKHLVPHESLAVYIPRNQVLVPEFVSGENSRLFSSLLIPLGEGLSGWVAQNNKPILNGNPSVEPGYLNDPTKYSTLRSALAVPLEGVNGVAAVLALYRGAVDGFSRDHLRLLQAISSRLGFAIEQVLSRRPPDPHVATDSLTGLPNSRGLFLHLEAEISRSHRSGNSLGVLIAAFDNFPQLVDRFGHRSADNILQMFAAALKDCCRKYDHAARTASGEFVLVIPGLTAETAKEMSGRLTSLAAQAGQAVSGDPTISASVAEAFYPDDGVTPEQLLSQVDHRLFRAKNARTKSGK